MRAIFSTMYVTEMNHFLAFIADIGKRRKLVSYRNVIFMDGRPYSAQIFKWEQSFTFLAQERCIAFDYYNYVLKPYEGIKIIHLKALIFFEAKYNPCNTITGFKCMSSKAE